MKKNILALAQNIIDGYRLTKDDDLDFLLTSPIEELQECAWNIQEHFCGTHIDLCSIINGRSGRCSEDCKYCAQAACHSTKIEEYSILPNEKIIAVAKANQDAGVNRFSIVTSGRTLIGKEFDAVLEAYREMSRTLTIALCASHGFLNHEQLRTLRLAGVTSYHHNIETSERFFSKICTSHTYGDRIRTIKMAQMEGFTVCSGGIIGMGETWNDRIDMALSLFSLGIKSIPINVLMPINGTPLEKMPPLSSDDILRTIAIFRIINPDANVRLAAGRKYFTDNGASALTHGASAAITGCMLTTIGSSINDDMIMLENLGLSNR